MKFQSAIEKAMSSLDDLGDSAIRKRILGLGNEDEENESPAEQAGEDAVGAEDTESDMDPELKRRLMELLSK